MLSKLTLTGNTHMKKFTAVYKDYNKNTRKITATDSFVNLVNQHNIGLCLTHLSHLIHKNDRIKLNGNQAESDYIQNAIQNALASASSNAEFVDNLNKLFISKFEMI
jgi:hypothetical protein